ncbi:MAG: hypothetical protein ACLQOO_05420 [Terriglobia bacterium]
MRARVSEPAEALPAKDRVFKSSIVNRRSAFLLLASLLLSGTLAWSQGSYKADTVAAPSASDVPKAVLDMLDPQGTRLVNDKGTTVADVWLVKGAALGQGGSSDAVCPGLGVGELVGLLHYPGPSGDFRGQNIKAGFYTLRYAHMPQDGNHMGANPYPDFLVLSPVAADTALDKALEFADLMKLSKQASGTVHPAVLSLIPVGSGAKFPSVAQSDQGYWALQMSLAGKGGSSQPMALVLVGQTSAE